MRNPVPPLDSPPADDPTAPALDDFLTEVDSSRGTEELLTGIYELCYPALASAYRDHLSRANPLVDQPTRRLLRFAVIDIEDAIAWGGRALAVVHRPSGDEESDADGTAAWRARLQAFLDVAGGVAGDKPVQPLSAKHRAPWHSPNAPDCHPRRDERFHGRYNLEFPPHVVYSMPDVPADERNLALLCKRTLEMDVPEMMASFMTEREHEPWEFYRDYSRQLWDEARHAMMGTVAFESKGIDWKREIPLNVSFALRLNLHADPLERQVMLYAIEQSLMPGETGKRYEYETALAADDPLSAHFHDYDWADEVLHAHIGRRMLKREGISSEDARERARAIHEKTWAALGQYKDLDEQDDWWPSFVRKVLGKESSAHARPPLNILAE
jgi:hypothetical protein